MIKLKLLPHKLNPMLSQIFLSPSQGTLFLIKGWLVQKRHRLVNHPILTQLDTLPSNIST
uniref:Uncharacterized protein n=1 Tax=Picea glauca TaxID=3330 RepID=A0A101LU23_PICGL|nr:hypothetical protein ABT39_MTgene3432 [Picea glauca]